MKPMTSLLGFSGRLIKFDFFSLEAKFRFSDCY